MPIQPDGFFTKVLDLFNLNLVGGNKEEFEYNGNDEPKLFNLEWLKKALKLKKLTLWHNEIVIIEKLTHLKELELLDLSANKI